MSLNNLLPDICVIQSNTETQDGLGEVSLTWGDKLTGVKTRYQQVSRSELVGDYQVTLEDYKFYFEPDTNVTIADRIVVDGRNFEIKHVATDSSKHYRFAIAKVIQYT